MRLIHITDPHLSNLEGHRFSSLSAKRRSGYLSWTRKRHLIHTRDTLGKLTAAIRAEKPDLLIVSGDLVQIGLESEFRQVSEWLQGLAVAVPVFLVPGNHDVYAPDSWPAMRRHWAAFLPETRKGEADNSLAVYPVVRELGSIRLIGASSACVTPIFSARGRLGKAQQQRLFHALQESRAHGRLPILAIHHPPLPGMAPWRKALKEVKPVQDLLAAEPPAAVFCGHLHHNIERSLNGVRVFSTASASSRRDASYRILDIEPQPGAGAPGWTLRMQLKTIACEGAQDAGEFQVTADQTWRYSL